MVWLDLAKTPSWLVIPITLKVMDAVSEARQLIRIVASDSGLPRSIRVKTRSLNAVVATKPGWVCDRLDELRQSVIPTLPVERPTVDYARCVAVEVFWRYCIRPTRQAFFDTANDYLRYLESMDDPAGVAASDLRLGTLVPSAHSWLVPPELIKGLDGTATKARLRINYGPPYIVMVFSVEKMVRSGVTIREPRGTDAVPGRLVQWWPGDVPDERIDQDIPTAALEGLEWRR